MSNLPDVLYITIPAYNELDLRPTLESIYECERPKKRVEVLVFINASESDDTQVYERNSMAFEKCLNWIQEHQDDIIRYNVRMDNKMSRKQGGVGLARKELMDEATSEIQRNYKGRGLIAALDADCLVAKNYISAIFQHFSRFSKSPACSVFFEHPLKGEDFPMKIYSAITLYELHLRYYKNALQYIEYPHYFYTVGSSMVVSCDAYIKQGGMNKRKAGEDFYFLQKMMLAGGFTELNETTVYPSPRPSERVPFGTGKAIRTFINKESPDSEGKQFFTYSFASFEALKVFFELLNLFYDEGGLEESALSDSYISPDLKAFLEDVNFTKKLEELHRNSSNFETFTKRFYQWFSPFMVLKFLHFSRDANSPNQPLESECLKLISKIDHSTNNPLASKEDFLHFFRAKDKRRMND